MDWIFLLVVSSLVESSVVICCSCVWVLSSFRVFLIWSDLLRRFRLKIIEPQNTIAIGAANSRAISRQEKYVSLLSSTD